MHPVSSPDSAPTPAEAFYASLLADEDRALYALAPGDPDLTGDIRLLRTLIARLAMREDMTVKENAIRQALGILLRLVQVQQRLGGDEEGDLERELRNAAALILAADDDEE